MRRLALRPWLAGAALGLVLALTLSIQSSGATCGPNNLSDYCTATYGLAGNLSAVQGRTATANFANEASYLPSAGALLYDPDHKALEAEAAPLLKRSKDFRTSISPHLEKPDFDRLVAEFDYTSGFNRPINDQPGGLTLQQRIDQADRDLRRARDLYAYLAVFANQARFRADGTYRVDRNLGGVVIPACPPSPLADDPVADPPVVDWCNFAARMREAVREAAYLRMIFGQQFTADALGLHFSGTEIVGGEAFVIDEVRKLQMAEQQYGIAEQLVAEGVQRAIGDGCLVSDFYSQAEWALMSRAIDGKERAQHNIAIRKSYLDAFGETAAYGDYRQAAVEQYGKLLGTTALAIRPPADRCARAGTRPDGQMLAEMATNMLETRAAARTLREGRNVFGYDIAFTPARPYKTAFGSGDTGILSEARRAADDAKQLQRDEEAATREFDRKKTALIDAIQRLKDGRDFRIQAESGCDRNTFNNDGEYFQCVQDMIRNTAQCDPLADTFDGCMARTTDGRPPASDCANCLILVSTMRQTRQDLRAAYLRIKRAQTSLNNLPKQIDTIKWRNTTINDTVYTAGREIAADEYLAAMLESLSLDIGAGVTVGSQGVEFEASIGASWNPSAPELANIRRAAALRDAANQVTINNTEMEAAIRDKLLELAELAVDLEVASQEFNSKATEYNGVVGQTLNDVTEAQRERAYLQANPANDPSYRLVRDSKRLTLANQLEYAAKVSYLAARRAEYEYAARLAASNFRISDIYRARTADDILQFLTRLEGITNTLVVNDSEVNQEDFTLSVALHVLGLTDDALGLSGPTAQAERTRRFREWVARNTVTGPDGKPRLVFNFTTSIASKGIFSNVIQQGYDRFWLHRISGIGQPKPGNTGVGVNLVSSQAGDVRYRRVAVTQAGLTHLRTRAGCIFDFRLIHPAALAGNEWPSNQPAESVTSDFKASVNGANGERTSGFLGRPVSATDWQVIVLAGAPEAGLPDLDLQQLTDIQLSFSTTRASRAPGSPLPSDCVRADFKAGQEGEKP